jgi:hypothetical protein
LIFGDELTASLFKRLRQDSRYRILPTGKPFVCPSAGTECPHPYELSVRVNQRMGDRAIATIRRIVSDGGGHAVALSEAILLVRQDGKWRIESVLSRSVAPMM